VCERRQRQAEKVTRIPGSRKKQTVQTFELENSPMQFTRVLVPALATLLTLAAMPGSHADDAWPTRQVRLIVPYAAGGYSDFAGRFTAKYLTDALHTSVIVENRDGAGGVIGTQVVVNATPDGYTLCVCGTGSISLAPLTEKIPYDPLKDLIPISLITSVPMVLAVNTNASPTNIAEFIQWAKAKPNGITYGSSGTGGSMHIAGEVFRNRTGLNMIHVPYRGSGLTANALLAGEIDSTFIFTSDAMGLLEAKSIRPLAISTAQRSPLLPTVPTVMEQGIPDYDLATWIGLMAPAGTPKPVIDKVAKALADMANDPEIQKMTAKFGATATADSPTEFAAYLSADATRFGSYLSSVEVKK
jgi:tripartite-type tricarboxylate transporter receptor subunit TctC